MVRFAGFGLLLLLVFSPAVAARQQDAPHASWATPKIGWSADSPLQARFRCTPTKYRHGIAYRGVRYAVAVLCSTSDGGLTWKPVFFGGSRIYDYVRFTQRAGVAITGGYDANGSFWWQAVWTLDAGEHWFLTRPPADFPESGPGFDPWDSCSGEYCLPTLRVGKWRHERVLLTLAPDHHLYVVRGLRYPQTRVGHCERGPVAWFLKHGPRNVCGVATARGWEAIWLHRIDG